MKTPSEQVRELAATVPGATTDELLHELLANLTALLGAKRAYVTEVIDCRTSRTVAAWEDGRRGRARDYAIKGTPCATVLQDGVQVIECPLADLYELETSSMGHGCDSFVGSPILDHDGERIGQLCVFGARPLDDPEMAGALVSLAAVRVSAELEHRKHGASLREQRRQLEVLLGNLPGMVFSCDYDMPRSLRIVSKGSKDLTGYENQELVDEVGQWSRLVHRDDRARVWAEIQSAIAAGKSYEVQYRIVARDGSDKWVRERGCGLKGNGETGQSLEGFVSDASALRESEAALARSEAYSKAIVATAAEGIITLDHKGRIESFNQAAEDMFGYAADELLGKDVNVLMPEPYRSAHTEYVDRYAATGEGNIIGKGREVPGRRKDGSIFPIYLAASEISLDDERCYAGIIRDISDQKAAEESLRATERRFRAVFDQRHQLVSILTTDGVVLEANQKSLNFCGLERESVIGVPFWDAPCWQHSDAIRDRMRAAVEAAASGETVQFEVTCPRCDGDFATLEFSVRPITGKSGNVVFLVAESHDITEKLHAEEEARQHRDRIAHVSRLSTLGEMAAGIAHEINQPLTAISLFAQAASRLVAAGDFDKMATVSEKLNEHALRASEVVERMQVMARQGESVRELIACNELISSAVRLAESEARIRDIRIIFDAGEHVPHVFVDAVQIQQVALNLLRNAMEAMLLVDCCDEKTIEISTRVQGDDVVEIAVTDCGLGISKENEDMLFKPFSTTKKSGMGMGLSISQAIVTSHGGRIDFRNNEPRGVTFWFTLPAASSEMQDG